MKLTICTSAYRLLALLVLLGFSACTVSKSIRNKKHLGAIKLSREILGTAKQELKCPAISIAVGLNNRVIWAEALGYENLEKKKRATVYTRFRVGSSSKAVTSMALGKLIQSGQINLDSDIRTYV